MTLVLIGIPASFFSNIEITWAHVDDRGSSPNWGCFTPLPTRRFKAFLDGGLLLTN